MRFSTPAVRRKKEVQYAESLSRTHGFDVREVPEICAERASECIQVGQIASGEPLTLANVKAVVWVGTSLSSPLHIHAEGRNIV